MRREKITLQRPVSPRKTFGFSLIEIILAIGMLMMSLISVSFYHKKILDVSISTTLHIQSSFLLEEGIEAVKQMRDQGWATKIAPLSTTTTYYFYWNGTSWTSTTTLVLVENIFTRTFVVHDVARDATTFNIDPAGVYDPGTKQVTVSVAWQRKGGSGVATDTAETYITNIFNN
jgi:Tfp pilus assembly protein PilV